jgi:hypothetical protein
MTSACENHRPTGCNFEKLGTISIDSRMRYPYNLLSYNPLFSGMRAVCPQDNRNPSKQSNKESQGGEIVELSDVVIT